MVNYLDIILLIKSDCLFYLVSQDWKTFWKISKRVTALVRIVLYQRKDKSHSIFCRTAEGRGETFDALHQTTCLHSGRHLSHFVLLLHFWRCWPHLYLNSVLKMMNGCELDPRLPIDGSGCCLVIYVPSSLFSEL